MVSYDELRRDVTPCSWVLDAADLLLHVCRGVLPAAPDQRGKTRTQSSQRRTDAVDMPLALPPVAPREPYVQHPASAAEADAYKAKVAEYAARRRAALAGQQRLAAHHRATEQSLMLPHVRNRFAAGIADQRRAEVANYDIPAFADMTPQRQPESARAAPA